MGPGSKTDRTEDHENSGAAFQKDVDTLYGEPQDLDADDDEDE